MHTGAGTPADYAIPQADDAARFVGLGIPHRVSLPLGALLLAGYLASLLATLVLTLRATHASRGGPHAGAAADPGALVLAPDHGAAARPRERARSARLEPPRLLLPLDRDRPCVAIPLDHGLLRAARERMERLRDLPGEGDAGRHRRLGLPDRALRAGGPRHLLVRRRSRHAGGLGGEHPSFLARRRDLEAAQPAGRERAAGSGAAGRGGVSGSARGGTSLAAAPRLERARRPARDPRALVLGAALRLPGCAGAQGFRRRRARLRPAGVVRLRRRRAAPRAGLGTLPPRARPRARAVRTQPRAAPERQDLGQHRQSARQPRRLGRRALGLRSRPRARALRPRPALGGGLRRPPARRSGARAPLARARRSSCAPTTRPTSAGWTAPSENPSSRPSTTRAFEKVRLAGADLVVRERARARPHARSRTS